MPLESVSYTGYDISKLVSGTKFSELNGHAICNKYVIRRQLSQCGNKNTVRNKNTTTNNELKKYLKDHFPEHFDTSQFRHVNAYEIKQGSLIYFTEKLHGTSGRSTRCILPAKTNWITRLLMKLGLMNKKANMTELKEFYGSRRKTFFEGSMTDSNFTTGFRQMIHERCFGEKLQPGETVYYEIVGYEPNGTRIMKQHDTNSIQDKKLRKAVETAIGEKGPFDYKYGCCPGTCQVYVYRMTKEDLDGNIIEYPWNLVNKRCKDMDVYVVPLHDRTPNPIVYTGEFDTLTNMVEDLTEYQIEDTLDHSHVREGICVRVESPSGKVKIYKNKTFPFKVMEGIAKEHDIDPEDEIDDTSLD